MDATMGVCALSQVVRDNKVVSTIEMKISFVSPALIGKKLIGTAKTIKKGKRILLKPNLVEPHEFSAHINTHPLVVRGAVEAFFSLGAASVVVAEGPGHRHDTLLVLEDSGLGDVLYEDRIAFHDLNTMDGWTVPNAGGYTNLTTLTFPRLFQEVDWIVSMAKMKELQPQMEKLKEKAGDDRQKMQQGMMELYKKEKVNPASGCLPILLQIPIFFSLYKHIKPVFQFQIALIINKIIHRSFLSCINTCVVIKIEALFIELCTGGF